MTTKIVFNGSKWAGQEPDSVDVLIELLGREPLEPRLALYGGFAERACGAVTDAYGLKAGEAYVFAGNFRNVSHAFSIATDDPTMKDRLFRAIGENVDRADYQALLRESREDLEKRQAAEAAALERQRGYFRGRSL
jgi:hypothetical protein